MTPNIGEDIVLFRSLQQLLSLPLDPLNGFLIWLDALQGPSTLLCVLLLELQRYRASAGQGSRPRKLLKTSDASLKLCVC